MRDKEMVKADLASLAASQTELAEERANMLRVALAIGVAYEPDSGPCAPGPIEAIEAAIIRDRRIVAEVFDLRDELAAAEQRAEAAEARVRDANARIEELEGNVKTLGAITPPGWMVVPVADWNARMRVVEAARVQLNRKIVESRTWDFIRDALRGLDGATS